MEMIVYLDSTTVLMNVSQKHWACGGNQEEKGKINTMSKHPCLSSCPPTTYQHSSKAILTDPTPFSSHKAVPGSNPTVDSALFTGDGMKC